MLAAENGALPGGKVGGMGDVLRDVPRALAALGHEVTVLNPAYGVFSHLPGSQLCGELSTEFRGRADTLSLHELPAASGGRLRQYVLEHPRFAAGGAGKIYCDDPPDQPFATDASKFALFCAAAADALLSGALEPQDVVHLHDWHSAYFALLLRRHPRYSALAEQHLVFTIHNLAMQGIRPLAGDDSSLGAWFPGLEAGPEGLDPRYPDCFNPVRSAINLCNQIHAVSPTYAVEICDPSGSAGEGLQADLAKASDEGRVHGILNGCEYPKTLLAPLAWEPFLALARDELMRWIGASATVAGAHMLGLRRVEGWIASDRARPQHLLTVVSRLTDQKAGLFAEYLDDGRPALYHLLDSLAEDEVLIVLGSGQAEIEMLFSEAQAAHRQLLYLQGYSDTLSNQLYTGGDLFLMPSRFEPCGIAQMLAMRAGQPCLVNRTGGLADTVVDKENGFVFSAGDDPGRARAMLTRLQQAMTQLRRHRRKRAAMQSAASAARFPWAASAQAYIKVLYGG
ncbi:MAG: starch synthase [Halieaceae bacterium]|jgi:starch synthase